MADMTIKLSCESGELHAIVAGLPSSRSALEKLPLEVRYELVRFAEFPQDFITVKSDISGATRTGEVVVRLDPSDRLIGLVAALGAWDAE